MKISGFFLLIFLFSALSASAAKVQGLHLTIPNLIVIPAEDIAKLESVVGSKEEKILELSEGRSAKCKEGSCRLEGKGYKAKLSKKDVEKFSSVLKKARAEGKEASMKEGEITLHCLPESCGLDLFVEEVNARSVNVNVNANVKAKAKSNFAGDLIAAIIEGMLKGLTN